MTQQPISPIVSLFLKLPPPPLAELLVEIPSILAKLDPENQHGNGTSQFLTGGTSSNGALSIVMLVFRVVYSCATRFPPFSPDSLLLAMLS